MDEIPKLPPGQWYSAQGGPAATPGAPTPKRPHGRGAAIALLVLGTAGTGLGTYVVWYATRGAWVRDTDLTQGLAIGAAGLVLLALGVQRLVRGGMGWIAAAATLLLPGSLGAVVVLRAHGRQRDEVARIDAQQAVFDRLMVLCTGGAAVPEAAPYERTPGLHPTAFFATPPEGETYGWFGDALPRSWRPLSAESAQLVACNKTTKDVLEGCSYTTSEGDRFVSRVRYVQELVLYEARTGKELTRGRLEGSEPGPCPEVMSFTEYETMKDITGTYPGEDALVDIVRPWVEPGGRSPAAGGS